MDFLELYKNPIFKIVFDTFAKEALKSVSSIIMTKIKSLPNQTFVEPEPYVAVPALQALSYSIDKKEIRELYSNILINSMKTDTKDDVHPAFVEIIKQMSPNDVVVFEIISNMVGACPIATPVVLGTPISTLLMFWDNPNSTFLSQGDTDSVSLVNLERLGLITINFNSYLNDTTRYNKAYKFLEDLGFSQSGIDHSIKKGIALTSALGMSFKRICIDEPS